MHTPITRTQDEIDYVIEHAHKADDLGCAAQGLSFEEGVVAALEWVTGISEATDQITRRTEGGAVI